MSFKQFIATTLPVTLISFAISCGTQDQSQVVNTDTASSLTTDSKVDLLKNTKSIKGWSTEEILKVKDLIAVKSGILRSAFSPKEANVRFYFNKNRQIVAEKTLGDDNKRTKIITRKGEEIRKMEAYKGVYFILNSSSELYATKLSYQRITKYKIKSGVIDFGFTQNGIYIVDSKKKVYRYKAKVFTPSLVRECDDSCVYFVNNKETKKKVSPKYSGIYGIKKVKSLAHKSERFLYLETNKGVQYLERDIITFYRLKYQLDDELFLELSNRETARLKSIRFSKVFDSDNVKIEFSTENVRFDSTLTEIIPAYFSFDALKKRDPKLAEKIVTHKSLSSDQIKQLLDASLNKAYSENAMKRLNDQKKTKEAYQKAKDDAASKTTGKKTTAKKPGRKALSIKSYFDMFEPIDPASL